MYISDMAKKKELQSYIEATFDGTPDSLWAEVADGYLIRVLQKKSYKIQHTSQTYRVINHWTEIGLVDDERGSESRGWRAFSMTDLIWIRIIDELRQFGFPLEKIAIAKASLFPKGDQDKFCRSLIRAYEKTCVLIVEKNGNSYLRYAKERAKTDDSHICVNVSELEKEVMEKTPDSLVEDFEGFSRLNADEHELLSIIRSGKYKSITVKMKDGTMERLEMEELIKGRMIDLLRDHAYQDIEVKTAKGEIVSMKRIVKHIPISKAMEVLQASLSTKPSRPSEKPKSETDHLHAHS